MKSCTTSWFTPYTFSGKEKDAETGYSYFGARYYDSDLSIWLSVDPMSDKYPSMSPYNYCADNPVILVDPDGREIEKWKLEVKGGWTAGLSLSPLPAYATVRKIYSIVLKPDPVGYSNYISKFGHYYK
jgi:RHS repeat-associated protein